MLQLWHPVAVQLCKYPPPSFLKRTHLQFFQDGQHFSCALWQPSNHVSTPSHFLLKKKLQSYFFRTEHVLEANDIPTMSPGSQSMSSAAMPPSSRWWQLPVAQAQDKPPYASSCAIWDSDTQASSHHQAGKIPSTQPDVQEELASHGWCRDCTLPAGHHQSPLYSGIKGIIFIHLLKDRYINVYNKCYNA